MTHRWGSVFAAAAILVTAAYRVEAHKPVTSKYTYTRDVLPIVRDKCATCHRPGGVAPMSLLTYEAAFPWAESIRAEIIAGHMPPAPADPTFGRIQHNRILTAREADVLLTWATGGNPKGAEVPATMPSSDAKWALGTPDLVLKLPERVTLPAGKSEETREFVLKSAAGPRRVRAVDVQPGTPAIVRNVTVSIKTDASAGTVTANDPVLCRWAPGQVPVDLANEGAAFVLPADAELIVQVHYKKTWQYDGKAVDDQSTIGLYFTDAAAHPIAAWSLDAPAAVAATAGTTYAIDVPHDADALGVRVDAVPPDEQLEISELQPNGSQVPLLRFTGRPHWERRYWFEHPVSLKHGSRIQIRATYRDPAFVADAFGGVDKTSTVAAPSAPLHLALDVTNQR